MTALQREAVQRIYRMEHAHHLLEVRHMPEVVHGVAMEATAQCVMHPTRCHLAQREQGHVQSLACAARSSSPENP